MKPASTARGLWRQPSRPDSEHDKAAPTSAPPSRATHEGASPRPFRPVPGQRLGRGGTRSSAFTAFACRGGPAHGVMSQGPAGSSRRPGLRCAIKRRSLRARPGSANSREGGRSPRAGDLCSCRAGACSEHRGEAGASRRAPDNAGGAGRWVRRARATGLDGQRGGRRMPGSPRRRADGSETAFWSGRDWAEIRAGAASDCRWEVSYAGPHGSLLGASQGVRVRGDAAPGALSATRRARAFTQGSDVFLGAPWAVPRDPPPVHTNSSTSPGRRVGAVSSATPTGSIVTRRAGNRAQSRCRCLTRSEGGRRTPESGPTALRRRSHDTGNAAPAYLARPARRRARRPFKHLAACWTQHPTSAHAGLMADKAVTGNVEGTQGARRERARGPPRGYEGGERG